jgi:hypothetical protein
MEETTHQSPLMNHDFVFLLQELMHHVGLYMAKERGAAHLQNNWLRSHFY